MSEYGEELKEISVAPQPKIEQPIRKPTIYSRLIMYLYVMIITLITLVLLLLIILYSIANDAAELGSGLIMFWGMTTFFQLLQFCLKSWFFGDKGVMLYIIIIQLLFIIPAGGAMFSFLAYEAATLFGVQVLPLILCICYMGGKIGIACCPKDKIENYYADMIVFGLEICFIVSLFIYCLAGCVFGFYLSYAIPLSIYFICDCFRFFNDLPKLGWRVASKTFIKMLILTLISVFIFVVFSHGIVFIRSAFYTDPKFEIVGHRGTRGTTIEFPPENSMAAFRECVEVGVDRIEADIQFTKDKKIVIMHDAKVDRTTNGTGLVKDLTWDEMKHLYLKTQNPKFENETVPLYEELLQLLNEPEAENVSLTTEIKYGYNYRGLEQKIWDELVKYNMTERNQFISFDPVALAAFKGVNKLTNTIRLYAFAVQSMIPSIPFHSELVGQDAVRIFINPWNIMKVRNEGKGFYLWFGMNESKPWFIKFFSFLGANQMVVDNVREVVDSFRN